MQGGKMSRDREYFNIPGTDRKIAVDSVLVLPLVLAVPIALVAGMIWAVGFGWTFTIVAALAIWRILDGIRLV